jgi:hypothetical protein
MSERPSIAREIADLLAAIPAPFAPVELRAAWTRRKAAVLRRIAAETDIPYHARNAAEQAAEAEQFAIELDAQAHPDGPTGTDPGSEAAT